MNSIESAVCLSVCFLSFAALPFIVGRLSGLLRRLGL